MKLNTKAAAKKIGGDTFSQKTLENWRCLGTGPPFYKIGNRVLYDDSELDTWLASRKRTSTSSPELGVAATG